MKYGNVDFDTYFKNYPDKDGYFGKYGGAYIPDELKTAMNEITAAYFTVCKSSKNFKAGQLLFLTLSVFQKKSVKYKFMQNVKI